MRKYLSSLYALPLVLFPAFAQAALDLDAVETSVAADGVILVAFGVALLAVIYAVRMVSWAKKI
jgi:hypothetical protein